MASTRLTVQPFLPNRVRMTNVGCCLAAAIQTTPKLLVLGRAKPGPANCGYAAQGGGSVSIRNGLPAGAIKVAYTTAFSVSLSLLAMKGAVPLSTNVS